MKAGDCEWKLVEHFGLTRFELLTQTLKKQKIETNSTWEGVFNQREWVKINSSWDFFIFSLYVCCANASELFCVAPFSKYWTLFIPF